MGARCPFCDRGQLEERLILETDHFAVIPTIGQVLEGYSLIVPKRHTIAFGDLSDTEMDEASFLVERVRSATTRAYGQTPIFFEHGIIGQTVRHAHIHAVPTDKDLLPRMVADFPRYDRIQLLSDLQGVFQQEGPYLFYENAKGERHVFHVLPKMPQYLRLVLAEEVGHPERGNWRTLYESPEGKLLDQQMMLDTAQKLIAALKP